MAKLINNKHDNTLGNIDFNNMGNMHHNTCY